jgi:hypothetical protein
MQHTPDRDMRKQTVNEMQGKILSENSQNADKKKVNGPKSCKAPKTHVYCKLHKSILNIPTHPTHTPVSQFHRTRLGRVRTRLCARHSLAPHLLGRRISNSICSGLCIGSIQSRPGSIQSHLRSGNLICSRRQFGSGRNGGSLKCSSSSVRSESNRCGKLELRTQFSKFATKNVHCFADTRPIHFEFCV